MRYSLICIGFSIILFFVQNYSVKVGRRTELPVINSLGVRIFPSDDYYNWFISHGMPKSDSIRKQFSAFNLNDTSDMVKLSYIYHSDSIHPAFFHWLRTSGESTYIHFLISHPSYSLLLEEKHGELSRIFTRNTRYLYIHAPRNYSYFTSVCFPIFTVWTMYILCIGVFIVFIKKRQFIYSIPICLVLVFAINIFLSYNADSLEVERHMFINMDIVQFISIFCFALLIDLINKNRINHKDAQPQRN
jgi:hypothetical protein